MANLSGTLNERALRVVEHMAAEADLLRIVDQTVSGTRVLDCGVDAPGGLQAGLALARVCTAGLAQVDIGAGEVDWVECPHVQVVTDHPVLACMASQYAGWHVTVGEFSAIGSGPMRAAHGKESIFDQIPGRERPAAAVGVLETRRLPDDLVAQHLAGELGLSPERLTLLVARASSIAGTVQVVARALETALHKLHELHFDLGQVMSGYGVAPLPPVAVDDIRAIGRTNDAILYGGRVCLWVRGDDAEIARLGPQVPSVSSPDHGVPFALLFERSGRDFYKIDPMLFSPAQIVFHNLTSGRAQTFGRVEPDILRRSFFTDS
jgi:methenyltetrahydromethanopterin cyclohydrolase